MKKLTAIILTLHLFAGGIYAQSTENKDPKAKVILDDIAKKMKSFNNIKLYFDYKIINNQSKKEQVEKANAVIQKNNYKIMMKNLEIMSDGKAVYTYQKEIMEITISENNPDEESIFNPAKIYSLYEKGFKYKLLGRYKKQNRNLAVIDLFPENYKQANYTRLRLEIDMDKKQIASFTTFGKNGINYMAEFSKYEYNTKLPSDFFVFQKDKLPEDIEIVDLR